ncbi:MAG: sugar phosphate isomerase/epimerase [Clostridia bacterium]|nr:sugar phosphate isomerase/epimerase [Clostridia bacterium]
MMKISVSSYSFSRYTKLSGATNETLMELAQALGFDGIEFTGFSGTQKDKTDMAKRLREKSEASGFPIVAYAVSADFLNKPAEALASVKQELDVAVALGVPVLRHDASFSLPDGVTAEKGIVKMAPYIREAAEYGASLGIRTCTENHGYVYQAPERVKALMEAVGHKNYGWLFDMGNFAVADRTATEALPLALPYVFHVHMKDMSIRRKDEEHEGYNSTASGESYWAGTVLGNGNVPVASTVRALRCAGYDGFFTYEYEGSDETIAALQKGLKFARLLEE